MLLTFVQSFTSVSLPKRNGFNQCRRKGFRSSFRHTNLFETQDENEELIGREALFEEACLNGAKEVSKMDIEERAKRAMLAEAVEDQILVLEDKLEKMIPDGVIPKDAALREKCVNVAREIKEAQGNYQSLVNGEKSHLLNSIENLGSDIDSK